MCLSILTADDTFIGFSKRCLPSPNLLLFQHNFTLNYFRTVVNHLHYDPGRQLLATVSQDNIIKLWNIKEMLEAAIMTGP